MLALGRTSPIISWLRALARDEHERCGGPGVGAVGHVLHRRVRPGDDGRRRGGGAGAQPAVPALSGHRTAPTRPPSGCRDADLERVQERVAAGTCVLGLRFTRGQVSAPRAVRAPPRAARRRVRRRRARLVAGQPPRAQEDGPLGAHRGPRRPAGHADPRRPRPGARPSSGPACSGERRSAEAWRARGRTGRCCGQQHLRRRRPGHGDRAGVRPCWSCTGSPPRSFDFHRVVDRLAADRRVVLFDMLGYGLSAKPDLPYRLVDQADLAVALVDRARDGPARPPHPRHGGHRRRRAAGPPARGRLGRRDHRPGRSPTAASTWTWPTSAPGQQFLSACPTSASTTGVLDRDTVVAGLVATFSPTTGSTSRSSRRPWEMIAHSTVASACCPATSATSRSAGTTSRGSPRHRAPSVAAHRGLGSDDPIAVPAMADRLAASPARRPAVVRSTASGTTRWSRPPTGSSAALAEPH